MSAAGAVGATGAKTDGPRRPGADAVRAKGWFAAHKWLLLRRGAQLSLLALFLAGPVAGLWLVKGTLAFSLTLDTLPLADPLMLLQSLVAGHPLGTTATIGAAIVVAFYAVAGGRVYCAWVCPINMVTDGAHWLRRRLGLREGAALRRSLRYWVLGMVLALSFATGAIVWELVNPITMFHRALLFGGGFLLLPVVAVFLFDLAVSPRGWCGHLCPVGAFQAQIGRFAVLRVAATGRARCNDCMDCYEVCPEPQVITPALRGAEKGVGPVILAPDCTNCGRCIDVCAVDVYRFQARFAAAPAAPADLSDRRRAA